MIRERSENVARANRSFPTREPCIKQKTGRLLCNKLGSVSECSDGSLAALPGGSGGNISYVIVPPGPTDCDPGQTAFFQTLQIATKIAKGRIEIVSPVELLKKGDKVGQSEAALLQKLNIEPFSYALVVHKIFDSGAIFTAEVLDLTDDMLASKMSAGLGGFAAICLATGYPTMASIPHSIGNAYMVLIAIAVECDEISLERANPYRARLAEAPK